MSVFKGDSPTSPKQKMTGVDFSINEIKNPFIEEPKGPATSTPTNSRDPRVSGTCQNPGIYNPLTPLQEIPLDDPLNPENSHDVKVDNPLDLHSPDGDIKGNPRNHID